MALSPEDLVQIAQLFKTLMAEKDNKAVIPQLTEDQRQMALEHVKGPLVLAGADPTTITLHGNEIRSVNALQQVVIHSVPHVYKQALAAQEAAKAAGNGKKVIVAGGANSERVPA